MSQQSRKNDVVTNPEHEVLNTARADALERPDEIGDVALIGPATDFVRAVQLRDWETVSTLFENAGEIHEDGKFRLAVGLALLGTSS
jgi:hypothetical protein